MLIWSFGSPVALWHPYKHLLYIDYENRGGLEVSLFQQFAFEAMSDLRLTFQYVIFFPLNTERKYAENF